MGVIVLAAAVGACAGSAVPTSPGCAPQADGTIKESQDFTPYDSMKTKPVDPIIGSGPSASVPARVTIGRDSVAGLARRYTIDASDGAVYSYFLDGDLGESKLSDFRKRGGIELDQEPDTGSGSFATRLLAELGDRATAIAVGEYAGALTWADPDVAGTRAHGVYWFDGQYNYALIADRPAEALVTLARTLVCGGS